MGWADWSHHDESLAFISEARVCNLTIWLEERWIAGEIMQWVRQALDAASRQNTRWCCLNRKRFSNMQT